MGKRRALWDAADVLNGHLNSPGRAGGVGGGVARPVSPGDEESGRVHVL